MWRLILRGELHRAPLTTTSPRVLDVGTGTGIWAIEFADEFPQATIVGNDLSPIQPTWVPPNLQFEIDDIEDSWPHTQPFDYVHVRNMGASIADWDKLCRQSLANMNPGGWLEVQEHAIEMHSEDGDIPPNTKEWLEKLQEGAAKFGKDMNVAMSIESYIRNAGFEDVRADQYKVSTRSISSSIETILISLGPTRSVGER